MKLVGLVKKSSSTKTTNFNGNENSEIVIIKANDLIEAFYSLSLIENKLVLLAMGLARNIPMLSPDTPIEISVSLFSEKLKVSHSSARKALHEAKESLANKKLTYYDSVRKKTYTECWCWRVSKPKNVATIEIFFTPTMISLINALDKNYTANYFSDFLLFKSRYGLRLFELAKKWQTVGWTQKYTIEEFREKMGVDKKSYINHSALTKNVIDPALSEINSNSDQFGFSIYCNRILGGEKKEVTHLQFVIEEKRNIKTVSETKKRASKKRIKYKLSEKQLYKYSNLLGNYSVFQEMFKPKEKESIGEYIRRIQECLEDEKYVIKWMDILKELGFVPSYEEQE